MEVRLVHPAEVDAETLVIFSISEKNSGDKKSAKTNKVRTPGWNKTLGRLLDPAMEAERITGEARETVFFREASPLPGYKHLLVVGLGRAPEAGQPAHEAVRQAAAAAYHALNLEKVRTAHLDLGSLGHFMKDKVSLVQAATEGLKLCDYDYDDFKDAKGKKNVRQKLLRVGLKATDGADLKKQGQGLSAGLLISDCVNICRRLGDAPGNIMNPVSLAEFAMKAGREAGLKVTAWDKARLIKEKMGGILGVAAGSSVEPRFIIMEYNGATKSRQPIFFVGKGLTFDSGGISIKPSASMDEMKYDMCGGAAVVAGLLAIAKLGLKVNAVGLVPAAENMPGPAASKPGDILVARNGKTVEVLNTDAEGRLILMDALSYAAERNPEAIFNFATLTGAIVVALGNIFTGYFTRNKDVAKLVEAAADASGERVWPMPVTDFHVADMKGLHADLSNISSQKGAGSSTAAAFLHQFVPAEIPLVHFDIAGTAWDVGTRINYCARKSASGVMVRTIVEIAREYSS